MTKVRTRFSPSPTGYIHLGNARAALFSALYATRWDGTFILRIEDTDMTRSGEQYVEALQEDLHWMGIQWQEGPGVGGEYGPYWQSQRQSIYQKYYQVLEEKRLIYPCFCTDAELALARKLQLSRSQAPRYAGTCKKLSADEIAQRLGEGKQPAWRYAVPENTNIQFVDTVKGPQSFNSDDIGDFIIRRADGTAPFLFCNAIDDATMEVTHVLRGEDHLANTPRQIMLLQAMELPIPHYGHLSLIVGDDGAPLSKRHGSFSIQDIHKQGFLPLAIINYLGRLGHTADTQELLPFDELAQHFDLEKLSRSPARFDKIQLMFWQKLAVQALDVASLWKWLGEHVEHQVPQAKRQLFAETIKNNIEFPLDAIIWVKIFFHDLPEIDEEGITVIREAGEQFFVEAENAFDKFGTNTAAVLDEMKKTLKVNGKKLFMPFRASLTGKLHGPELKHIVELLGQDRIKHRLGRAVKIAVGETL